MNDTITTAALEIVELSIKVATSLEKWSDQASRPNDLSVTECVGFTNKDNDNAEVSIVLDLQAPEHSNNAILRAWAISITPDDNGNERFNNIQINFDVDYAAARTITQKGSSATRDDLKKMITHPDTRISEVVISDETGFDQAADQPLGKRYQGSIDEINQETNIDQTLSTVLSRIRRLAK